MPVTPTYPGVYIEEVPSGVRTITGVATSITAFIGRALRGPINESITLTSFGDFERAFGGMHPNYPLSYTVRDFYLNGGSQAIIVRLFRDEARDAAQAVAKAANDSAGTTANAVAQDARNKANEYTVDGPAKTAAAAVATAAETAAVQPGATPESVREAATTSAESVKPASTAKLMLGDLKLEAASPGTWGNKLQATVDYDGITAEVAERYGLTADDLFNLTVLDNPPNGLIERLRNLSVIEGPRRVDRVLAQESQLVRVQLKDDGTPDLPTERPDETEDPVQAEDGSNSMPLDQKTYTGSVNNKTGMFALEKADLFNLLCLPADFREGDTLAAVYQEAMKYCKDRRAMLLVDSPASWATDPQFLSTAAAKLTDLGLSGIEARNSALYFPRVIQSDPLREGQLDVFVPCGIVAGVMARTDAQRGVWKAPAGLDAALNGIQGLQRNLTDAENGLLNPLGINCLRSFPVTGRVVWGARTLRGADQLADEYKYVPVRRIALFIEESLYRGLKWVVFEPNDEPLWSQIRLNVGAFMQNLFRQGAFQGRTASEAYFVKCDKETTTQNDINLGIVNILVGFAPLKPAEFVVIKIQQMAGQIQA